MIFLCVTEECSGVPEQLPEEATAAAAEATRVHLFAKDYPERLQTVGLRSILPTSPGDVLSGE